MRATRKELELKRKVLNLNKLVTASLNQRHFEQAQSYIFQAKLLLPSFTEAPILHSLTSLLLNTEACLRHNQQRHAQALDLIEEAIKVESQNPISLARSYLNQSVILSDIKRHEESLEASKKANKLLSGKGLLQPDRFGRENVRELYVISMLTIANQYERLGKLDEAIEWYCKGYQDARMWMGEKHQLTNLVRSRLNKLKKKLSESSVTRETFNKNSRLFRVRQKRGLKSLSESFKKEERQSDVAKERLGDIVSIYKARQKSVNTKNRRNNFTEADEMREVDRISLLYRPERYRTESKIRTEDSINGRQSRNQSFY